MSWFVPSERGCRSVPARRAPSVADHRLADGVHRAPGAGGLDHDHRIRQRGDHAVAHREAPWRGRNPRWHLAHDDTAAGHLPGGAAVGSGARHVEATTHHRDGRCPFDTGRAHVRRRVDAERQTGDHRDARRRDSRPSDMAWRRPTRVAATCRSPRPGVRRAGRGRPGGTGPREAPGPRPATGGTARPCSATTPMPASSHRCRPRPATTRTPGSATWSAGRHRPLRDHRAPWGDGRSRSAPRPRAGGRGRAAAQASGAHAVEAGDGGEVCLVGQVRRAHAATSRRRSAPRSTRACPRTSRSSGPSWPARSHSVSATPRTRWAPRIDSRPAASASRSRSATRGQRGVRRARPRRDGGWP